MNLGFGGGGSEFQIPVLSAIVGMIADLMRIGLQICYEFTSGLGFPNYVIAIVVLTILIKTLLLPLAVKQIRSMKAMQAIQPEIQKIQKKYRNGGMPAFAHTDAFPYRDVLCDSGVQL